MDQLTSELSRISVKKSSTEMTKFFSSSEHGFQILQILSSIRQAKAAAFMATFTVHVEDLPEDVRVYLREEKRSLCF